MSICLHSLGAIVSSTFSKVAPAAQAKRHFLFAKLFLLGLFPQKKKRLTNLAVKNCLAFVTDARGAPLQYVQYGTI